jgi:hypothetical protein
MVQHLWVDLGLIEAPWTNIIADLQSKVAARPRRPHQRSAAGASGRQFVDSPTRDRSDGARRTRATLACIMTEGEIQMPRSMESRLDRAPHVLLLGLALTTAGIMTCSADSTSADAEDASRVDPETGAVTRSIQTHGVELSLTQLLPDQVRAFYIARGFDLVDAEVFASACVYMTVLRNVSAAGEISFRLADWSLAEDSHEQALPSLDTWLDRWEERGVPSAARLAFRWAQFPPEQSYARGEWNQGMLATGLAPGRRFDLIARWTVDGQPYQGRLTDVACTESP